MASFHDVWRQKKTENEVKRFMYADGGLLTTITTWTTDPTCSRARKISRLKESGLFLYPVLHSFLVSTSKDSLLNFERGMSNKDTMGTG